MPDMFGQETPQEAINRVRQSFRQSNENFGRSGMVNSPGAQAGQALANIFGGTVRAALDTRRARKSTAQELAEQQGISMQDARTLAKKQIPFATDEVRQAGIIQRSATDARKLMEEQIPLVGEEIARSNAMLMQSRKLREMGFHSEATQMTLQAVEIRRAEEDRIANLENLKARTESAQSTAALNRRREAEYLTTDFGKEVSRAEELRAKIDTSSDPAEIASLERQLGATQARIDKLTAITGTTEHDPSALSNAGRNAQASKIIEAKVLDTQLADLEGILLDAKGDIAATMIGRVGEWTLGYLEDTFNRTPDEDEAAFMERVRTVGGAAAFIGADIRHALTGAAMSPAEAVFLEPFLPTPGEPRSVMLNKVRVVRRYTQLDIATRTELLRADSGRAESFMNALSRQVSAETKEEKKAAAQPSANAAQAQADADVGAALAIIGEGN